MKRLSRFSRFEQSSTTTLFVIALTGSVWLSLYLHNRFTAGQPFFVKALGFVVMVGAGSLVLLVAMFTVAFIVNGAFTFLRRITGRKTLREEENEISDANEASEDLRRTRFQGLPPSEQQLRIWEIVREQQKSIERIERNLINLTVWAGCLLAGLVAYFIVSHFA